MHKNDPRAAVAVFKAGTPPPRAGNWRCSDVFGDAAGMLNNGRKCIKHQETMARL